MTSNVPRISYARMKFMAIEQAQCMAEVVQARDPTAKIIVKERKAFVVVSRPRPHLPMRELTKLYNVENGAASRVAKMLTTSDVEAWWEEKSYWIVRKAGKIKIAKVKPPKPPKSVVANSPKPKKLPKEKKVIEDSYTEEGAAKLLKKIAEANKDPRIEFYLEQLPFEPSARCAPWIVKSRLKSGAAEVKYRMPYSRKQAPPVHKVKITPVPPPVGVTPFKPGSIRERALAAKRLQS